MAGIEEILGEHGENYFRASVDNIDSFPAVRYRFCSFYKKEMFMQFNAIVEELDCKGKCDRKITNVLKIL